jgi:glycosyltransferase involved in cell wall biosynthesis
VGGRRVRAQASDAAAWNAEIVVGVALHNQREPLAECLASIAAQHHGRLVSTLIVDDGSTDGGASEAASWLPRTVVVRAHCGSAARARNTVLDLADLLFPHARWVARLDADDRFTAPRSLAAACALAESRGVAYVVGGNRLRRGGALLERSNPATERLLDAGFVVRLLERMAEGVSENELPSCNLVLARGCGFRYPEVPSAEDHWLVADLLINRPHAGAILTAPFYCDYTLDGEVTRASRRSDDYRGSRRALHTQAQRWVRVASCC